MTAPRDPDLPKIRQQIQELADQIELIHRHVKAVIARNTEISVSRIKARAARQYLEMAKAMIDSAEEALKP